MYLIIFTVSLFFMHCSEISKSKYKNILFAILAIFILSLFAGLRDYTIGTDVLLYGKGWFEKSLEFDSLILFLKKADEYSIGIGYAALNFFVSRISVNFHFFLFIFQFIHLTLIYVTIRSFKSYVNITFAFFIYLFSFYNISFNILRQIMAVSIVFFGFRYIQNRKLIKYLLTILLAWSFHSTAIIGLLLYPISRAITNRKIKKVSKMIVIISGILSVIGFRYIINFLNMINIMDLNRYMHYLTDETGGGRFVRLSYWLFVFIVILLCRKCIKHKSDLYEMLEMYMLLSTFFSLICFLGGSFIVRIAYYIDFYQILYLPFAVRYLPFTIGNKKNEANFMIIGLFIFIFWVINIVIRNNGFTYPYSFMN